MATAFETLMGVILWTFPCMDSRVYLSNGESTAYAPGPGASPKTTRGYRGQKVPLEPERPPTPKLTPLYRPCSTKAYIGLYTPGPGSSMAALCGSCILLLSVTLAKLLARSGVYWPGPGNSAVSFETIPAALRIMWLPRYR